MFKITMLCYDNGNPIPYEDEPAGNNRYTSFDEAYNLAVKMAQEEVDYFNEFFEGETPYGLSEDEYKYEIVVYHHSPTEPITVYYVEKTNSGE